MTHQQQAVALYEAMGWEQGQTSGGDDCWINGDTWTYPDKLPPIDHNFLAAAREKLLVTKILRESYVGELSVLIDPRSVNRDWGFEDVWNCVNALPDQQLTAIVKTLGLWKEPV